MKVDDGKHFLDILIQDAGLAGRIICKADPKRDVNAACRMAPDAAECMVKYAWSNLSTDMLSTSHHAIREIHAWTAPLPIIYKGEGSGEDYEDWVIPDLEHPSYPRAIAAAFRSSISTDTVDPIEDGEFDDYAVMTEQWSSICAAFDEAVTTYYDVDPQQVTDESGSAPGHVFSRLIHEHGLMLAPATPEVLAWWRRQRSGIPGLQRG